ncbi:MAG: VCBS repeat-containing protein [Limisphaera sp.]|nr:VCBS repeat-containing protein [Limisphaera sp.]
MGTNYGGLSYPRAVVVGDFDRDGWGDVGVLNSGNGTVSLLMGNGDGTLRGAVSYGLGSGDPYQMVVGDWNGDGWLDVAVADYWGSVRVMLNDGAGGMGGGESVWGCGGSDWVSGWGLGWGWWGGFGEWEL